MWKRLLQHIKKSAALRQTCRLVYNYQDYILVPSVNKTSLQKKSSNKELMCQTKVISICSLKEHFSASASTLLGTTQLLMLCHIFLFLGDHKCIPTFYLRYGVKVGFVTIIKFWWTKRFKIYKESNIFHECCELWRGI